MLPKFVRHLWAPFSIVIYSSQVVQGISVRQNDVWRQWPLWLSCDRFYQTKRGQGEVSDQRRHTIYRKWDKRQFQSFFGRLKSDPPSSPGSMEDWSRPRGGLGWSCAFTCFDNLTEAGQSGSGTSSRVTRLCTPVWPRNQPAVFSLGFSKREPTCEIQEIEKHFQTDYLGLLR